MKKRRKVRCRRFNWQALSSRSEKAWINEWLDRNFTYHKPRRDQAPKYTLIRKRARYLAELIYRSTPQGRERALAITALEEAVMWANAGIARG